MGVGGGGGVVVQSSLTLGDPLDGSLPGFSVHDIFQARIMEWVCKFCDPPPTPTHHTHVSAEILNSLYSSLIIHGAGQL